MSIIRSVAGRTYSGNGIESRWGGRGFSINTILIWNITISEREIDKQVDNRVGRVAAGRAPRRLTFDGL